MYLGWALFGLLIVLKIILCGVALEAASRLAACGALISAALIGCGLIVFVWVQPANIATSNWATQPSIGCSGNWNMGISLQSNRSLVLRHQAITFRHPKRHTGMLALNRPWLSR